MAEFKVVTYEMKSGLFGTNVNKADNEMSNYLNKMAEEGWECISIATFDTSSKNFMYKIVFKKVK